VDAVQTQMFRKEQFVVRAGEKGSCVYMVEEGEAVARIHGMDARSYKRGGYFGELSLINDRPRAADVVAASDTLVVAILYRQQFARLLGKGALSGGAQPQQDVPEKKQKKGAALSTRFVLEAHEDESDNVGTMIGGRRGTGYIQANQLKAYLDEADKTGQDQVEVSGVKFLTEGHTGDKNTLAHRKGTGFVQTEQLRKLLSDAMDKGIADDEDIELFVRFDAPEGVGLPKTSIRRGTGFVQTEQALKLLAEDHDEGTLRFAKDVEEKESNIQRKGTGFVQAEHLKKLLAEADANGDDEVEIEDPCVRFKEDTISSGPKRSMQRKGTGFIQAEQLRKLLIEAQEAGDDEVDVSSVRFNVPEGTGEPKQSIRRGTGFVQGEMLQKLIAEHDAAEAQDQESEGGEEMQVRRSVSFHQEVVDNEVRMARTGSRSSAGEIFVPKELIEAATQGT